MSLGKKWDVYVTRSIPGPAIEKLEKYCNVTLNYGDEYPDRSELLANIKGKNAILCMLSDRVDHEVIAAAGPNLKVISSYSTGIDHIDVKEATKRGIYVTYMSDILSETTADLTFALILSCARRLYVAERHVRNNEWKVGWTPNLFLGSNVYNKTLGILGLGRIGSAVAKRAKGFGMKILYNSATRKPDLESQLGVEFASLDTLFKSSDFISIHTSLNPSTFHLINENNLKKMKSTAFIINTARGSIINENDLISALENGVIAGAGLDVYEKEPIGNDNKLIKLENVTLLPHIGSAAYQTRVDMANVAVDNILEVMKGNLPKYLVNQELIK